MYPSKLNLVITQVLKNLPTALGGTSALVGFSLAFSGCQLPTPQKVALNDASSYYISASEGKFTTTSNHPSVSIPIARTLNLTACLRDNSRSIAILSHRFVIRGGKEDITTQTDSRGCLVWDEEMSFDFLADEKYITLRRTLHPEGQQKGDVNVDFIVNPWSAKVYGTMDSRVKNPVPPEKSMAALSAKDKEPRALWLDWVRVNVMQERIQNQTGSYIAEVSAGIAHERLDDRGERELTPLTYGKILGRVHLICAMHPSGRAPMRVVIAQMDNIKADVVNNNRIFLTSKFTLSEFCPTTAFMIAAISVKIENGPQGLAPFHGLFHAGPVQNMVGANFSAGDGTFQQRFMKDKTYSVEQYLADNQAIYRNGTHSLPEFETGRRVQAKGNSTLDPIGPVDSEAAPSATATGGSSPQVSDDNHRLPPDERGGNRPVLTPNGQNPDPNTPDLLQKFRIEVREITATTVGFPQQNVKTRTLVYRTRACLRLGISQEAIRASTFTVHKLNGQTEKVTSLDDGCLEFQDSIEYNHFNPECWFEKNLRFENADYGYNESFKIQINPWSRGSQWFKDVRWLPQNDRTARCMGRSSQILMDVYFMDFSANRYLYSIDDTLNLNLKKVANISLRPMLYRPSFDASQGYVTEPMPAGKYLLRYALIDQSVTDYSNLAAQRNRIYSIGRALVSVREDGAIADQVTLSIQNEALISLGVLNQFVIELVPLKEGAALSRNDDAVRLESFVDRENAIKPVPYVAQFIHRAEGGGLRRLDDLDGQSLVLELEKTFQREQREIQANLQRLADKNSFAKINFLKVVNLNETATESPFRLELNKAIPFVMVGREVKDPVPMEMITQFTRTGKMSRELAVRMCGYFFKNLWTEKLPGKDYGLLEMAEIESNPENMNQQLQNLVFDLQKRCVGDFTESQDKAFDVEFEYLTKKPSLQPLKRCERNDEGQEQCHSEIAPERVEPRSFSVSNSFSLSRSYGAHWGQDVGLKLEAGISKIIGIGGGYSYSYGTSESTGQSNSTSIGNDLSLVMETLRFHIRAENAEKCVMVRLNPALFDQEESRYFGLSTQKSLYARMLNEKLTAAERPLAKLKGLMLCDGAPMNQPLQFIESYFVVRPNTPTGMVGDEKSRATVDGLFATLRGINDMTAFMATVTNSEKLPPSFQRELQAKKLDSTHLREAIGRGSQAIPGIFSSPVPLNQ